MHVTKPYNNEIIVVKNFISFKECSRLLKSIETLTKLDWAKKDHAAPESLKSRTYELSSTLWEDINQRALDLTDKTLDCGEEIYLQGFNTVIKAEKEGMPAHHDGGDGLENVTKFGYVLYLNTSGVDYTGGELYYTQLDIKYVPVAGDLVIHPGTFNYEHRVNDITSGIRYVSTSFAKTVKKY